MAIFCDTHVHCYEFKRFSTLLDYAWSNFMAVSATPQQDELVLFFTDGVVDKTWHRLNKQLTTSPVFGEWIADQPEAGLIRLKQAQGSGAITLAPARQLNSEERLEFLLLGCAADIEDGLTAERIIQDFNSDYVVICPWGVGKWMSLRGQLLTHLIADHGTRFQLGDNGGRPGFWSARSHFNRSPHTHINGSDPLPVAGELHRVGSFGVRIQTENHVASLDQLLSLIESPEIEKSNFGTPMSMRAFVKKRIQMILR